MRITLSDAFGPGTDPFVTDSLNENYRYTFRLCEQLQYSPDCTVRPSRQQRAQPARGVP